MNWSLLQSISCAVAALLAFVCVPPATAQDIGIGIGGFGVGMHRGRAPGGNDELMKRRGVGSDAQKQGRKAEAPKRAAKKQDNTNKKRDVGKKPDDRKPSGQTTEKPPTTQTTDKPPTQTNDKPPPPPPTVVTSPPPGPPAPPPPAPTVVTSPPLPNEGKPPTDVKRRTPTSYPIPVEYESCDDCAQLMELIYRYKSVLHEDQKTVTDLGQQRAQLLDEKNAFEAKLAKATGPEQEYIQSIIKIDDGSYKSKG